MAAEALAAGTPVAAFERGALPEILTPDCGRLAPADDVDALATALREASALDRNAARRRAETFCSHERMVDEYVALLLAASLQTAAA